MSLPGSTTTAATARPTDFGAPFSPVVIVGIAAGSATGAGLLLIGIAFLLAYATLGKEEDLEDNNGLGLIGVSDLIPERVAGYEPLGARMTSAAGSSNELLRQPSQSARGAEISTPMNLDLVGFTPEPYESVSGRAPRGNRAQQQEQASYFVPPLATPQQNQRSYYLDAPYNRPRESKSSQQEQGNPSDMMVRKEPQRGTIQSQTSYYSDSSDPPYARLRGQGSSKFEFQDDTAERAAAARRREEAIARKQEANYYSDGRYQGRAAYDRY